MSILETLTTCRFELDEGAHFYVAVPHAVDCGLPPMIELHDMSPHGPQEWSSVRWFEWADVIVDDRESTEDNTVFINAYRPSTRPAQVNVNVKGEIQRVRDAAQG